MWGGRIGTKHQSNVLFSDTTKKNQKIINAFKIIPILFTFIESWREWKLLLLIQI